MIRLILFIIAALSLTLSTPAHAQQAGSHLQQTVNPIECIFTQVSSGEGLETSSSCADQVAPTLEQVVVQPSIQPVLFGHFASFQTKNLRIWVGGTWYTLGSSPYISATGDEWQLNLLNKPMLLSPGTYTIVVETLTYDSFRLSSMYANALTIPTPPAIATSDPQIGDEAGTPRSPRYSQANSVIFPLEQFELPAVQNRFGTYTIDLSNKAPTSSTAYYTALWWLLAITGTSLLVLCALLFMTKQRNDTLDQ